MPDNIVPFGRAALVPTTEVETSVSGTTVMSPETAAMQVSIDSLIRLLNDNRHQIESFMGVLTLKETSNGASGFQLFTSPMSLASFSLGVRILDHTANVMLHGGQGAPTI